MLRNSKHWLYTCLLVVNDFRVMRGTARPRSKSSEDHTVKDTTDIVSKKHNFPEVRHQPPTKGNWVSKRHVVNNYILLESLGSGSYGQVRLCKRKETDVLYAIKIISKELLKKRKAGQESTYFDDVRREIAIMKKLDHPNVVKLYEVMDDPKVNKLYLVLEYMQRKDLMQLLKVLNTTDNNSLFNATLLPDISLFVLSSFGSSWQRRRKRLRLNKQLLKEAAIQPPRHSRSSPRGQFPLRGSMIRRS